MPMQLWRQGASAGKHGVVDIFGRPRHEAASPIPTYRDGFADFYGYGDDDSIGIIRPAAAEEPQGAIHLPDQDDEPATPRTATEASLAALRDVIEDHRRLLCQAQGPEYDRLQRELKQLKLQQARLAEALWHIGEEAQVARTPTQTY
mmetsp:Transcript_27733/g.70144  ORF Transcript_27733/g.70144 Transcript_27733/m.70144 type:complete len:147 (+) Transcript_27733:74-514(+)